MPENFYLKNIRSVDKLKELFIERWNWENPEIYRLYIINQMDVMKKQVSIQEINGEENI